MTAQCHPERSEGAHLGKTYTELRNEPVVIFIFIFGMKIAKYLLDEKNIQNIGEKNAKRKI